MKNSKDTYHIKLTSEEAQLVERITLDVSQLEQPEMHAVYKANEQPVQNLLKSLNERRAIPKERLFYWQEPTFNTGDPRRSHKGVFEKNGCRGAEIYTHLHFLPYLRYFLFGANLPEIVIAQFEEQVGDPDDVTSGDIAPLGTCARKLICQHSLDRTEAAEEFYKLCLDMGLGMLVARHVRGAVMRMRAR